MITLTLLLGCSENGGDDDNADDSSDVNPDSGGEGCGASLCGCSDPATLEYEATVIDSQTMAPLSGVEVYCLGETTPIATSDDAGLVGFSIETQLSDGCGYDRCNNLRFHATTGTYADLEEPVLESNGDLVEMTAG